jgi:hypothetical protein
MPNGCQLEGHQIGKLDCMCPCHISTSYPTLELIHLVKHNPTSIEKTHFHFLSFFNYVSILVASTSSFCSTTSFYLSFSRCESLSTASLFTPCILPKTDFLVVLAIFCTLGATQEEWGKKKCKMWNGREGPTFILGGPIELFPIIIVLFIIHGISSWILIRATHYTFSLDSENVLLPKHDTNFLMLFSHSFSLDVVSTNI